jgi:hypothetical protein
LNARELLTGKSKEGKRKEARWIYKSFFSKIQTRIPVYQFPVGQEHFLDLHFFIMGTKAVNRN